MPKLTGYMVVINECQGNEPKDALIKLSTEIVEAAKMHNVVPQGGLWMLPYVDEDGIMHWVVAQAMVQWEVEGE